MGDAAYNARHLIPRDVAGGLYWLRALGRNTLPETLEVDASSYSLVQTLKHDFYAATGVYRDARGEGVVLKVNRTTPCAGIPLTWLGRYLRNREVRFYRALADMPQIPRLRAVVGTTAFVHDFVPGQPLSAARQIPDGFFDRLLEVFRHVHARGIAYVDSHKRQNILVGDDGKPYLVDFQVSLDLRTVDTVVTRWLLKRFQWADVYHVLKHKSRLRPDELTPEEWRVVREKSLFIRVHRWYTRPYQLMLEWLFLRWQASGKVSSDGSE